MNRKEFVRLSAAVAAGAAALPVLGWGREPRVSAAWPAWPDIPTESELYWKFVRDQFPLTRDRAYLNTGGLGASPYVVIDAVTSKMAELEKISETGHSEELWKEVKTSAAELLGCDADELAFTRNTTEGVNIVANGFSFHAGDEIITTTQEHVGNALTWLALAKRAGVVLKLFEPSTVSEDENIARIAALITGKTRLISIPHAVTTTGTILPVARVGALARERHLWYFIDGAQTAGMFPFNLHEIGCDAYATSGHKWLLGPKETGLLYVRKEMLETIRATSVGAYSDGGFDFLKGTFAFHPSAQRYEYGTVSVPLRVGLGAAIAFIRRIGIGRIWDHDRALATALCAGLGAIAGVTVLSPERDSMRSAMVTFRHEAIPYADLQKHLDAQNLRTRAVTEGGLGALRVSFHVYNSADDVQRVIDGVRTARKALR